MSVARRLASLSRRQWITAIAALLAAGGAFGLVVMVSGAYNVSAASGHAPGVEAVLRFALVRSVALHSRFVEEAPVLDEDGRVRLGAAHFHDGCGTCHGYPGSGRLPVFDEMLPAPPDLSEAMLEWNPDEAFWLVQNGLKYTGMPSWPGDGREDEVWSVVAFLLELPGLDADEYLALANGNTFLDERPAHEVARFGQTELSQTACARCHDTETAPPTSTLVPSLGGQSAAYLVRALESYRSGRRESGIMEPIAAELGDEDIAGLAALYAGLDSPPLQSTASAPDTIALGREIAHEGSPIDRVPACESCHSADRLDEYPVLAGLPAEYLIQQLDLWRDGGRRAIPLGRTMAVVAERLDERGIRAVAAYYASLERSAGAGVGADAP